MNLDIRLPNQKIYRGVPIESVQKSIDKGKMPTTAEARVSGDPNAPWQPITNFVVSVRPSSALVKSKAVSYALEPVSVPISPPPPPRLESDLFEKLAATNLPHQPFPTIVDPIDYEPEAVWIRPPKKKTFFKRWEKRSEKSKTTVVYKREKAPSNAGCAPAFLEVFFTICTGGALGGIGVIVAGKGGGSLVFSILCFIAFWVFNGVTLGLLLVVTLPLYVIFVLLKLVFDLSASLS